MILTVILIAAVMFLLGLTMIAMFRSVVSADDELERRLADARRRLADREESAAGRLAVEAGDEGGRAEVGTPGDGA